MSGILMPILQIVKARFLLQNWHTAMLNLWSAPIWCYYEGER